MFAKKYDIIVESRNVVRFVRILGKFGVRFEMGDEWNSGDQLDPGKKTWYRSFRIYTTAKKMDRICKEMKRRY